MTRHFRPRRIHLLTGLACAVFCGGMAISMVIGAMQFPDRPMWQGLLLACPLVLVMGLMAAGGLWLAVVALRGRLTITADRAWQRRVTREESLSLAGPIDIDWRMWLGEPLIVLRAGQDRLTTHPNEYSTDEQIWLTRWARRLAPETRQTGWPQYCQRFALRLMRQSEPHVLREPGPGEVRVTRRRWAWYFAPSMVVMALAGAAIGAVMDRPFYWLLAPIPIAALWGLMHFSTPRRGTMAESVVITREGKFLVATVLVGLLGLGFVRVGLGLLEVRFPGLEEAGLRALLIIVVLLAIAMLWALWRLERRDLARRTEEILAAPVRWAAMESELPPLE